MKIDPNDFVITRRRKLYKFAQFANLENCFELDEWQFPKTAMPVSLEIGAGTGLFSVERAALHPDRFFIALDVKADRLQKGARAAQEQGLANIAFVRSRADQLAEVCPVSSVDDIWVTFPDPFPKKRAAKHRLTHPRFLEIYASLLTCKGHLFLKHDNLNFFTWSLEQLVSNDWIINELSFDLHESELPDEYKLKTTYENRWISEGGVINFVSAQPRTKSA
jgi:tRNA (guanine-N7-)-methyltransferase